MKAVAFTKAGGPEVLNVAEIADPEPGKDQVRIRVHAATVNPTDTLFRAGRRQFDPALEPAPWVPGQELAGYVDAVGAGVTTWHTGDRVAAVTRPAPGVRGAQAELALVWADSIARVPATVSLVAAATLPMNGLTALQAMDRAGVARGGTILVTGAAGAVGGYVLQLSRTRGIRTIAVSAAADEPLLRQLGADHFIPRDRDVVAEVRRIAPTGVDAVIDAALIGAAVLGAVRDRGRYIGLRGRPAQSERDIELAGVAVADSLHDGAKLAELMRLVESGALTLRVGQVLPPDRAADAHRQIEAGGVRGRLVIQFRRDD